MEPEDDNESSALERFMALLIGGGGQHEPDFREDAPTVGPRRDVVQPGVAETSRHARDCPAETEDVAICTCGAMFRMPGRAVDAAETLLALAKIV